MSARRLIEMGARVRIQVLIATKHDAQAPLPTQFRQSTKLYTEIMDIKFGTAIVVSAGWLFSLCLHEFGHALVAYLGGDKSVKEKGYLTFNLFRYADPGLTIVVPLIILMIGGIALPGAAVYINRGNLRNRLWGSLVSLAGPVANGICLLAIAYAFKFRTDSDSANWLWSSLALLALLQTIAVLLNSLPIPPLDGFGVIEPWLPPGARVAANNFGRYGIWVLFAALWLIRPLNELLWGTANAIDAALNVPFDAAYVAFAVFRQQSIILFLVVIVFFAISRRSSAR
jgi:Zn-dependent protease